MNEETPSDPFTERSILLFLQSEYKPEIVLLGGSRAQGTARPDSDWDLYLIGDYPDSDHCPVNFKGVDLDIGLYPKESLSDHILRIYYGPVSHLKVLKDNQQGQGERIANETKAAYQAGPPLLSADERKATIHELSRLLEKTKALTKTPAAAAFRLAEFYRGVLPAWFSLRNKWSLPVRQGLAEIGELDPGFADLLDSWARSGSVDEQLEIGHSLVTHLAAQSKSLS